MSRLKKFDEAANKILTESRKTYMSFSNVKVVSRKTPTIEQIKEELLKLSHKSSWDEFLNEQNCGDCDIIAKTVSKMFPKVKMVSVRIIFSDQAKAKMAPQDDPDMYTCTHYLNKLNGKYIDFGKATNIYEDVYVLDGIDDIKSCEYTEEGAKHLTEEREENPRQLGTFLR